MASKRQVDEGLNIILSLVVIGFVIAFFLIKWVIAGIFFLAVLFVTIAKAVINNNTTGSILNKSLKDSKLKIKSNITKRDIIRKLNLFDISIYDSLFEENVRYKGMNYYHNNKVKKVYKTDNMYTTKVSGTSDYTVNITFDNKNNNKIINSSCNCYYYINRHKSCKHIYATLLKIKCDDNKGKIIKELDQLVDGSNKIISELSKKVINKKTISYLERANINQKSNDIKATIKKYNVFINYNPSEQQLLDILYSFVVQLSLYIKEVKKALNKNDKAESKNTNINNDNINNDDKISLTDLIVAMALSDQINKYTNNKNDKIINEEFENECNIYGLSDHERQIIKDNPNTYDVWDFEEDEDNMDEDSYYKDN